MKLDASLLFRVAAPIICLLNLSSPAQTSSALNLQLQRSTESWLLGWNSSNTGMSYTVQFQDSAEDLIWRLPESTVPFPLVSNQWYSASSSNASRLFRVVGVASAERGRLLSIVESNLLSVSDIAFLFGLAGVTNVPHYGVHLIKLVYETIDPLGTRTRASGALLLPDNAPGALPLMSYQHGTITLTNDAPSSFDLLGEVSVGVAFATDGYVALVPDYLGLGDSPGFHPYHHAKSEATACVDMLRAAKTFCSNSGVPLDNKLFLCGYSQGGHATLALLRELETYHTNEFTVTACAAMAGAYDLSGVMATNFLSGAQSPNPYYLAYLLAAYENVYRFAPSLSSILRAPYDVSLPPLLDGAHSGSEINRAMPTAPALVLKPEYWQDLQTNPRHPVRLALADNDLYRWRPRAPLRLYHCAADQDVLIANSQVALASFHALGASQVELIDLNPNADHAGCSEPSLQDAKAWFDSLK